MGFMKFDRQRRGRFAAPRASSAQPISALLVCTRTKVRGQAFVLAANCEPKITFFLQFYARMAVFTWRGTDEQMRIRGNSVGTQYRLRKG